MIKDFFEGQKFIEGDVRLDHVTIEKQIGRGNSDVFLGQLGEIKVAIKQT